MFNSELLSLLRVNRLLILLWVLCLVSCDQVTIFLGRTVVLIWLWLLLIQSLLLEKPNFGWFFQGKLWVLAVDAFWVNSVATLLDFNLNFDKIFSVHFATSNQCQQESFMCWVDTLHFHFNKHVVQVLVLSTTSNGRLHVLDVHWFGYRVFH